MHAKCHFLPPEYESDFGDLFQKDIEPTLEAIFYPNVVLDSTALNTVCKKYSTLLYNGIRYKEHTLMFVTNNAILFPHSDQSTVDLQPRPALLKYFLIHSYHYRDIVYTHLFAVVSWLMEHHAKYYFVKPFELWWRDLYDTSLENLVPIQLLICHAVHCNIKYEEQTVCLMCPVQNITPL